MGIRASKLISKGSSSMASPKGYVPVSVGIGEECKRFMIHLRCLRDADLLELLCISEEEYGFHNQGVLRIPCDAKTFEERMLLVKDRHRVVPRIITA